MPRADIWNKPERSDGANRPLEPPNDVSTVVREGRPEECAVLRRSSAVGRRVCNEQAAGHRERVPAEPSGDDSRQPVLPIERAQELPDVDELGLDLDDEKGAHGWVPAQKVDDATLAELREGDLGSDLPGPGRRAREHGAWDRGAPGCGDTDRGDPVDSETGQRRVPYVQDTIDVDRSRSRVQLDPDLEGAGDGANGVERNLADVPALDARHGGPGGTGLLGEIELPPATPDASHPDEPSEPKIVHRANDRLARLPLDLLTPAFRTPVRYHDLAARVSERGGGQPPRACGQGERRCWQPAGGGGSEGPERGLSVDGPERKFHNM